MAENTPREAAARPAAVRSKKRPSSRRWKVIAVVCGSIAALAAATVAGWAAANTLVVAAQDRPQAESVVISIPEGGSASGTQMPDVRGLAQADAEQALVDAGLPASIVTVTERAAAGPAGRVIQQVPVFGASNPSTVSLVVSLPAEVPEVSGRPAAEVIDELQLLGARVDQIRVYEPGAEVGDAVRTDPAAGSAVPEIVTLYIADTAVTRNLGDFDRISGGGSSSSDALHEGIRYDEILSLSADDVDYVDDNAWRLGGAAASIEGEIALEEDAEEGFGATVIVLGDGQEIARVALTSAAPVPVSWSVQGVDTLVIRVVRTNEEAWGDVEFLDVTVKGTFSVDEDQP